MGQIRWFSRASLHDLQCLTVRLAQYKWHDALASERWEGGGRRKGPAVPCSAPVAGSPPAGRTFALLPAIAPALSAAAAPPDDARARLLLLLLLLLLLTWPRRRHLGRTGARSRQQRAEAGALKSACKVLHERRTLGDGDVGERPYAQVGAAVDTDAKPAEPREHHVGSAAVPRAALDRDVDGLQPRQLPCALGRVGRRERGPHMLCDASLHALQGARKHGGAGWGVGCGPEKRSSRGRATYRRRAMSRPASRRWSALRSPGRLRQAPGRTGRLSCAQARPYVRESHSCARTCTSA
eukprot:365812-Chlamydomonas_euryale.AAC.5